MSLILERNCDGGRFHLSTQGLGLSPPSHLIEVEGGDVDAVTGLQGVLVEVVDMFRRGELDKVGVEQIDGRLVDVEVYYHFVALDLVVVGGGRAGHHLLSVNVWN